MAGQGLASEAYSNFHLRNGAPCCLPENYAFRRRQENPETEGECAEPTNVACRGRRVQALARDLPLPIRGIV